MDLPLQAAFVPEFVTWAIPALATMVGALIPSRPREPVVKTLDSNQHAEPSALNRASSEQGTVERVERSANQRIHPTTGQAEINSVSEVSSKHKHTDMDPVLGRSLSILKCWKIW